MKVLTKFIQQDFIGSQQSLSLLNTEMSQVRKAVFQNRRQLARRHLSCYPSRILHVVTQWICSGIIFIKSLRTQVKTLSDLTWGDLVNQWFRPWGSWWKELLLIWGIILICVFSCTYLYCYCCICLHCIQTAAKQITWLSKVEKWLEYCWSKMLQPKFQMAVFLHILLGINKHNLNNIHWALVGVREWVYNLMCTFSPGHIKWILNLVYWKGFGNNKFLWKLKPLLCFLRVFYN